jgi:hypothetical protein
MFKILYTFGAVVGLGNDNMGFFTIYPISIYREKTHNIAMK